jgi:hypothetical protein
MQRKRIEYKEEILNGGFGGVRWNVNRQRAWLIRAERTGQEEALGARVKQSKAWRKSCSSVRQGGK